MIKQNSANLLRKSLVKAKQEKEDKHPKLSDSKGLEYLAEEVRNKLYNPLFHQKKYAELGISVPRTVLLHGVEGIGKSYLLKAFARDHGIQVHIPGYLSTSLDVREFFRKINVNTEKGLVEISQANILRRMRSSEMEENEESVCMIVRQIKECIERIESDIVVVFTYKNTKINFRTDSEIFMRITRRSERKEILESLMKGIRKADSIDFGEIAERTPGFVPQDLVRLVRRVSDAAVSRATSNIRGEEKVEEKDFMDELSIWKNKQEIVLFDDIGALDEVKEELENSILLPSRYPEKFQRLGIGRPSGILLHGPPGCGKTLIAKAISSMSYCRFVSIKGPELVTKYVGDTERQLRELFEKAKSSSPSVIFFDEIDSLCGIRGRNEHGSRMVNQILTLMDGIEDRGEVYVIGATNRLEEIDEALLRPGRFDKVLEVPLPGRSERYEILRKCLRKIPMEDFDIREIDLVEGMSGAEISGIVKEAATLCLRENFDQDDLKISKKYFEKSLEKYLQHKKY